MNSPIALPQNVKREITHRSNSFCRSSFPGYLAIHLSSYLNSFSLAPPLVGQQNKSFSCFLYQISFKKMMKNLRNQTMKIRQKQTEARNWPWCPSRPGGWGWGRASRPAAARTPRSLSSFVRAPKNKILLNFICVSCVTYIRYLVSQVKRKTYMLFKIISNLLQLSIYINALNRSNYLLSLYNCVP